MRLHTTYEIHYFNRYPVKKRGASCFGSVRGEVPKTIQYIDYYPLDIHRHTPDLMVTNNLVPNKDVIKEHLWLHIETVFSWLSSVMPEARENGFSLIEKEEDLIVRIDATKMMNWRAMVVLGFIRMLVENGSFFFVNSIAYFHEASPIEKLYLLQSIKLHPRNHDLGELVPKCLATSYHCGSDHWPTFGGCGDPESMKSFLSFPERMADINGHENTLSDRPDFCGSVQSSMAGTIEIGSRWKKNPLMENWKALNPNNYVGFFEGALRLLRENGES